MLVIGCTGGIGSGKSSVCALLATKGAKVIDADEVARAAIEPGGPGFSQVIDRFGEAILDSNGAIVRGTLAAIVFSSETDRAALEAIIHPLVEAEIKKTLERIARTEPAGSGEVVVLDVALLLETNGRARYELDGVLVVDAPEELAIERLVRQRHLSEDDARARVAAQLARAERLRQADFVIVNVGTRDELAQMADNAWTWIEGLKTGRSVRGR